MDDPDSERFDPSVDLWVRVSLAGVVLAIPLFVLAAIFPLPWPTWAALSYSGLMAAVLIAMIVRDRRRS